MLIFKFPATLVLLFVCTTLPTVFCITRAIRTDTQAFPFIFDLTTNKKIDWTHGRVAEYLASSIAVRISVRGVRFIHRWFTLRFDTEHAEHCVRSTHALCVVVSPWQHLFPTHAASVVLGGQNKCTEVVTGRQLQLHGYNDISLCDVLSGHQNILLSIDGHMESKSSMLNDVVLSILATLTVFVIGCIVHRFSGGESKVLGSMSCTVACVLILVLVLVTHDPHRLYVTHEDMGLFFYLIGYTIFNIARWSLKTINNPKLAAPYSICVGALNLLSFRLFATVDNPCSPFIAIFLLARVMHKLKTQEYRQHIVHFVDIYLDVILLSLLVKYGVFTQYESELKAAMHLALTTSVLFIAFLN